MSLSLVKTQALNELANLLYSFLPGKAHPLADQTVSFQSIAGSLGLGQFWPGGSKLPAITKLLTKTFQYRSDAFCPLLIKIVQTSMLYRLNKGNPITQEEMEKLNSVVAKIGFKIPELHDPVFLGSLPREYSELNVRSGTIELTDTDRQELKNELVKISSLSPLERGFKFEGFLSYLFDVFSLAPRGSFRLVGEQIDGSFQFEGGTYLLEATWQGEQIGQEKLLIFSGKVGGKAQWSRGLLVSYSGFVPDGLEAFARGKPTNIICMDGLDLFYILEAKLDLCSVLERKVRRAAETNQAYVTVRDLFLHIS